MKEKRLFPNRRHKLSPRQLEPRRLLNAEFAFSLGTLTLDNFTNDFAGLDQVEVAQAGATTTFSLTDGVWSGLDAAGITGDGLATLSVDTALLNVVDFISNTGDQFDIEFNDLQLGGDVNVSGTSTFGLVTQATGSAIDLDNLSITAADNICLTNDDNDLNTIEFTGVDNAEVVDTDDLIVIQAEATTQIWLAAGDGDPTPNDGSDGTLTLNGSVSAATVLLQASEGVDQSAGTINATNLFLGGDDATENSGTFDLQLSNNIQQVSASLAGDLFLASDVSLEFVSGDFDSFCDDDGTNPDTESFNDINIGGNLDLNVQGNIGQNAAAILVSGDSTLVATGEVCLNDPTNDFVGQVDASGTTVELVDANALDTGVIDAVDDIYLRSGATGAGALTLNGNLTTTSPTGQVLLQSDSGVTQVAGVISTNDLLLGGDDADEGSGNFSLDGANAVNNLAADLQNDLTFVNTTTLDIADLTYSSSCGTNEVIVGASIGGNLDLDVTGDITQSALILVAGTSLLTATGDICLTDPSNDFVGEVTASGSTVELVDTNALTVGVIDAADDIYLRSGATGAGLLTLNGNLTTSSATGQVLLQSDSGVNQAAGVITTNDLLLGGDDADEGSGNFDLTGANAVTNIGGDLENDLVFVNSVTLDIADLSYDSDCGTSEAICGVNVGGNLDLTITGDLTQTAALIVAGNTVIMATDDICLTGGDCTGDGLNDNSFGGTIDLDAGGEVVLATTGNLVITADLVSSGGNLRFIADSIDIQTDVVADQLLLEAANGVALDDLFLLDVTDLLLSGGGTFDIFTMANNAIDNLATSITGDLDLNNSLDLNVAKLTFISDCGNVQIDGVTVSGNANFTIAGSLNQTNAPVIVGGTTVLDVTGDICLIGGDCDGNGNTDNDFNNLQIVNATNAEVLDANELNIVSVNVTNQLWLAAGDNDATPGDGAGGALTLNGNVTVGTQALLQASEGINQAAGVIDVNQLLLGGDEAKEASGDFILNGNNVVSELAATLVDNLQFTNTIDLLIVKATYTSICDPLLTEDFMGLDIGGDLAITVNGGNLDQTNAPVIVGGTTVLDVTGDICLIGGDCDGNGNTDNDFNNLQIVNATNAEVLDANDLNIVSVNVTNQLWLAAGDNDATPGNGAGGTLTLNGNVTVGTQALLQASEGINQAAGVIDVNQLLLGGDEAKEASGDFILNGNNVVSELAATLVDNLQFTNTIDLLIVKATYTSICDPLLTEDFMGLDIGGNLTINVNGGSLDQTDAPVIVVGNTVLDVTGDICLIGGDCDGNGNTDNDFSNLQIVNATNAEVLDANDLNIVSVNVTNQLWLAAGDNDATPGNGAGGTLTLNGNVTVGNQALLQASEGVNQAAGVIDVNQLLLGGDEAKESTGDFVLNGNNVVSELAATLVDNLQFTNTIDLTIVKATYTSICDPLLTEDFMGLDIGSNLTINVNGGSLDQTDAPVIVVGNTVLDVTGDICLIGGDCDGNGNTDNDFSNLQIVNATNAEVLDANDLNIVSINVTNQLWLAAGDNDATPGNGAGGTLTLNGNVTVGTQALLQASEGVNQAAGVIDVNQLLLGGDEAKESTGDFILNGNNVVSELAATLVDNLQFTNTIDLLIVKATYTSICDPLLTEDFMGLDIGGNLTINVNGGSLDQTDAPVIVVGNTVLDVTGDICLIGGDCDGNGNTDNDFSNLQIVNATNAEVLDANDLNIVSVNVTNQLWLAAGDNDATPGDGAGGTLTLNGNVTVGTQALLQASEGVNQAAGVIDVNQLLLGGDEAKESTGDFILNGNNVVSELAATLVDNLEFTNTVDLTIVKATYTSICDPLLTEEFLGLDIGGNLTLILSGDISQLTGQVVVSGDSVFDVVGDVCLIGGDCDGDGNSENDFNNLQIVNATNAEVLDANDLNIVSINVTNQLWLAAGDDDAMPGNGAGGTLSLNGNVTVGSQALLQASEGINQAAGVIDVNQLLLGGDEAKEASGDFILNGNNVVSELAATLVDNLQFTNTIDLLIVKATYTSICDPLLTEDFMGLDIGGDLAITVNGGNLDQTDAPVIVGGTTVLDVTGDICLIGGDCDGNGNTDNDFNNLQIVNATNAEVLDANDLNIVSVNVTNQLWLAAGDNDATPGDGAGGALTLNGNVTVGTQALLQASEGINQAAGVIDVNQLLLGGDEAKEASGDFILNGNNVVSELAATLVDNLQFTNTIDLLIVKATYTSICDPLLTEDFMGLDVGGDLAITVNGGNLDQTNAPVIVGGTTVLDVTGDICLIGGDCDGNGNTDNDFNNLQIVNATNAEVLDANELNIVSVNVTNQLWLAAGDNDATPGNGAGGALTLNGNVTVGTQALLQASEGINQAAGVIDVNQLLLGGDEAKEASGDFILNGNNVVSELAATLVDNLQFTNTIDLLIVKATYTSICDPLLTEDFMGLDVGGDLAITVNGGNLDQTDAPVIVGGTTVLDVTGDICLIGGDCDGNGNTDNDFSNLQIVNATNAEVLDANDLSIVSVNVTNQLWLAAGDNDATPGDGAGGTLTLNGNVTVGNQALLQASEGINQAAGVIDANQLLLGGDEAKESTGDFILNGNNVVSELAATLVDNLQFTNTIDLLIVKATYTSICDPLLTEDFMGLDVGGDLAITVNGGNLDQTDAPVIVVGNTVLDVTGDICLIGGDCDGNGNTDNDFSNLQIVNATNAEVLDANDLSIVSVNVTNQLWLAAGDNDATPGNGAGGTLTLNGNVTVGTQALLQASEGVNQAAGVIDVNQLLLGGDEAKESTGDFVLNGNNVVSELAATLVDNLQFTNTIDLTIVKATYTSICDPLLTEDFMGLDIGGNLTINVNGGSLDQTDAPVIVVGNTVLDVTGDICLIGGDCDGNGNTDNDFNNLQIVNATNAEVLDANDLNIVSVNVTNQLWLAAGDNDATPGNGAGGTLTLNGNVTVGTQALLQASEGVNQAAGVIDVNQLLLGGDEAKESTGDFVLNGNNVVSELAATLVDNLQFTNTIDLTIVKATYTSICDPLLTEDFMGLDIGGNLTINVNGGSLDQSDAPVIVVGNTVLDVTGDICLIGGDCDGNGNTDNDFSNLQIVNATNAEVLDANDLNIVSVNVTNQLWLAAGDADAMLGNGAGGTLTLNGNVTVGNQALLQASEGVNQAAGVIDVNQLLLGGDEAKESTGDYILNGNNVVSELAATLVDNLEFTNTVDLTIVKATYRSICDPILTEEFLGLNIGGNLDVVVNGGSLDQADAPVIVSGATVLDVTGDICLADGDCDGNGVTENDLNTLEIVNAINAEVVDSNDLTVISINVTNQLWLAVGDADLIPGDGVGGTLTLVGNVTADTQVLLQASEGVEQVAGIISVDELLLGGNDDGSADVSVASNRVNTGDFNLTNANDVQLLSANLLNDLNFANAGDLVIASLDFNAICTPHTEAFVGLTVLENLDLVVGGDLSQQGDAPAVIGGTTFIAANGIDLKAGNTGVGSGTNNDFVGDVTVGPSRMGDSVVATPDTVEIFDLNDFDVARFEVSDNIFIRSGDGDGGVGSINLLGDLESGTDGQVGQILLQSDNGVTQFIADPMSMGTTSEIRATDLLLGEIGVSVHGAGFFQLDGDNFVSNLSGSLGDGSVQFNNQADLSIQSLTYDSRFLTTQLIDVLRANSSANLVERFSDTDFAVLLADTTQAHGLNPDFDGEFLTNNGAEIGIGINNDGAITNSVIVDSNRGDIFFLNEGQADDIDVDANFDVNLSNKILVIAGGDLLFNDASFVSSVEAVDNETLINNLDEFEDVLVLNPGPLSISLAVVDVNDFNQQVLFTFGAFDESVFSASVFWGLTLLDVAGSPLVALDASDMTNFLLDPSTGTTNSTTFNQLYDLLEQGFESNSGYTALGSGDQQVMVLSDPIRDLLGSDFDTFQDLIQTIPDSAVATASFDTEFLAVNSEFRNILFVFNSQQLNIFQNATVASREIEDLNFAAETFEGIARIGQPPSITIERPEFQLPTRVELTPPVEFETVQTVFVPDEAAFVPVVRDKFFVVVYFETQADAELFQDLFGEVEQDFESDEIRRLLKDAEHPDGYDNVRWETESDDVNRIRDILQKRSGLDLEDKQELLKELEEWIKEDNPDAELNIPRGIYKIIVVEDGKALIQGDDVDRRFVPEKVEEGGEQDYEVDDIEDGESDFEYLDRPTSSHGPDGNGVNRLDRWHAILGGQQLEGVQVEPDIEPTIEVREAAISAAATTSLLGLMRKQKTPRMDQDEESEPVRRNLFSRVSRFSRRVRNQQTNT